MDYAQFATEDGGPVDAAPVDAAPDYAEAYTLMDAAPGAAELMH